MIEQTDDLHALEQWAGALLSKFEPAARRRINMAVGEALRRSQQQRIKSQKNSDGSAYDPRKPRKELRQKAGRIKRRQNAMFQKIRTSRYMRVTASASEVGIEIGRAHV